MNVVTELRRARRARRLGDTDWFDLAYRVYLVAIFGGAAAIVLSDYIGDAPIGAAGLADVWGRGPAVIGIVAALALAAGLRSGAEGGPISIEAADVRHLLAVPVKRSAVLRLPVLQRLRSVIGGATAAGAVVGLLAAQRLPGTAAAWTFTGAGWAATVAAVYVGGACVWHASRWPASIATAIGVGVVGAQVAAAITRQRGPLDSYGGLALWGYRQHRSDGVAIALSITVLVAAVSMAGRFRVEHLARRGALVSQLRFAVTMQDLRTVVLLRRQLRQETLRSRPWIRLGSRGGGPTMAVVRRATVGFLRSPAARLGRIVATGAAAGVSAGLAARGTTVLVAIAAVLLFVLGLELVEPLAQEIDHPARSAALPRPEGWLYERLLVPAAVLAVPAAIVAAAAFVLVVPNSGVVPFVIAVPAVWCGIVGGALSTVRDAVVVRPQHRSELLVAPPEMAGMADTIRLVWPVAVAGVGVVPVLIIREYPEVGVVVRCVVGLVLYLVVMRWWIVHRRDVIQRWHVFAAGARP